MPDLPPEAYEDCFHPPSIPTQVFCLHCQEVYDSYLIEWREEKSPRGVRGFWRCPTPGCSGAGFGFDIHPIDPEYIDPDGRDMGQWCFDDEDEEDWDEDECMESDAPGGIDSCGGLDPSQACQPTDCGDNPAQADEPHELDGVEPSLIVPNEEPDPFAIPMDDLLPVNDELNLADLTSDEMDEIERKLGWRAERDEGEGGNRDSSSSSSIDGRGSSSRRSSSQHDERDWIDDDDIPF